MNARDLGLTASRRLQARRRADINDLALNALPFQAIHQMVQPYAMTADDGNVRQAQVTTEQVDLYHFIPGEHLLVGGNPQKAIGLAEGGHRPRALADGVGRVAFLAAHDMHQDIL